MLEPLEGDKIVDQLARYLQKGDGWALPRPRYDQMARRLVHDLTLTDLDHLKELFP